VNRESARIHFPKDTEAGRSLAQQIFRILTAGKCPRYRRLLEAAKAEFEARPAF
jgi:hypothetical protein